MNTTLTFYLNQNLNISKKDIEKLGIGDVIETAYDAEDTTQPLDIYRIYFKNMEQAISTLMKLEKIKIDYNHTLSNSFSRIMVVIDDVELEEKKINFTQNPHAQHIHIFNRNNNGMIRIKELGFYHLLQRTITVLKQIEDELFPCSNDLR